MNTPTFNEAMESYKAFSRLERLKSSQPCEGTVKNTLKGTRLMCRAAGISLDEPVTAFTRTKIDEAIVALCSRGVSRISVASFLSQFRALFAKWTISYYRATGWEVPQFEFPSIRSRPLRYRRPGAEVLQKVKAWYLGLEGEIWLMATMMLEFAMRNGDVLRLKEENFLERDGRIYLSYTPHKTEFSSARHVLWPVHPDIWSKIEVAGGLRAFDISAEFFVQINRQLRQIGFNGHKASYELRKICIDHIYQKFGAEMATSISGDDIRTISRYYADPSQPNAGNIKIIDII